MDYTGLRGEDSRITHDTITERMITAGLIDTDLQTAFKLFPVWTLKKRYWLL